MTLQPDSASGYLRRRIIGHLRVHGPSTVLDIAAKVPPYYSRPLIRYALYTLEHRGHVTRDRPPGGRAQSHVWRIHADHA
jgi:hypothetical protein